MFKLIVKLNNFIIKNIVKNIESKDIVILGSRCLQASSCDKRISDDIENCVKCGKCNIKDILDIKEEYGIKSVCIATGGTLARNFVREHKPKLVLAIACKRELALGILGVLPNKSFGIFIDQPCGPCKDTVFQKERLINILMYFRKNK